MANQLDNPHLRLDVTKSPKQNVVDLINRANGTNIRADSVVFANPVMESLRWNNQEPTSVEISPASDAPFKGDPVQFFYNRLEMSKISNSILDGDFVQFDGERQPKNEDVSGLTLGTREDPETGRLVYDFSDVRNSLIDAYGGEIAFLTNEGSVVLAGDTDSLETMYDQVSTTLDLIPGEYEILVEREPDLWVDQGSDVNDLSLSDIRAVTDREITDVYVGQRELYNGAQRYFSPGTFNEANDTVGGWASRFNLPFDPVESYDDVIGGMTPRRLRLDAVDHSLVYINSVHIFYETTFADMVPITQLNGFAYPDGTFVQNNANGPQR